jgi:hypothetical protein
MASIGRFFAARLFADTCFVLRRVERRNAD